MNTPETLFCLLCFLTAAAAILGYRRHLKKTLDALDRMLELAREGTSIEENFDESRMSALQTRFAHYLSASALSARNVSAEKDRIKTLIADISHQTKTPIATLLLHSELLKEESLTESARGNAEAIYDQSQKLRFLIDALVQLARLENGIIALSPHRGPLYPMLQSVAAQFTQKASEKGLFLKLEDAAGSRELPCDIALENTADIPADISVNLTADVSAVFDRKWTEEALGNIVDNAVKYTARGGVTISAVCYDMFARIDVADSGIGISEAEQARVFSRFYRSQDAGELEGLGIGLYLAREIISGQGGYIRVSSAAGRGSVFSVFLPR